MLDDRKHLVLPAHAALLPAAGAKVRTLMDIAHAFGAGSHSSWVASSAWSRKRRSGEAANTRDQVIVAWIASDSVKSSRSAPSFPCGPHLRSRKS